MTLRTRKYDLINHPFFQSWIRGDLSEKAIGLFAHEYYHQVASFADYLRIFETRLAPGQLKEQVSKIRYDIEGKSPRGGSCAHLWLNFAHAFAENNKKCEPEKPGPEMVILIDSCTETMLCRSPSEILAALWSHESTVAALSREQSFCMRRYYKRGEYAREFFEQRYLAAIQNRDIWCEHLNEVLLTQPYRARFAIDTAEIAAFIRWNTIDALDRKIRAPKT